MKIAIDTSPLSSNRLLTHRVRGTGFYLENLKKSLIQYYPENQYIFYTKRDKLDKDIDIVHYPYFEPFFLTLPLKKITRTVVTVHDLIPFVFPRHFPSGVKGKIKWWLQRYALRNCDAIITDSRTSKNDIIKFTSIPESKITIVYLAASEEYKKIEISKSEVEELKEKYKIPDDFVLYVGDATWNKNLPRLLKGIKKTNMVLVMVGKALVEKNIDKLNPWNQDLLKVQEMAEQNKRVIRLGFVPNEDLVLLYNLAKVFVMPSLYEGFGLPVLEAMQCGCPVVTTKDGSLPEIAEDASIYVNAYDINSIADGIEKVFSSRALQKELSEKGLIQSQKFSWKKTTLETLKVYEKIHTSSH